MSELHSSDRASAAGLLPRVRHERLPTSLPDLRSSRGKFSVEVHELILLRIFWPFVSAAMRERTGAATRGLAVSRHSILQRLD